MIIDVKMQLDSVALSEVLRDLDDVRLGHFGHDLALLLKEPERAEIFAAGVKRGIEGIASASRFVIKPVE